MATTMSPERLVARAVAKDDADEVFASAVRKARRALKHAPGGRRSWIFKQAVFGAYKPQKALCEIIDTLIDAGVPREDIDPLAYYFVSYVESKYAAKEAKPESVKETLVLAVGADTAEVNAEAAAIANPESESALENVIETTVRDDASNKTKLDVCRSKLARIRFGRQR